MGRYSIKDLEKVSGIKAHTIRMWERRYGLIQPKRTSTNIRYYSDNDLKKLLNIAILNQHGIRISQIAKLTDGEIKSRVLDLSIDKRSENTQIENLTVAMLELNETRFVDALSSAIIKYGFEVTVETIIFPFLERVGLLWQAGTVCAAEEHFISNLIRQKLFVAIDNEISLTEAAKPRIIMFLPENEWHEIGLLFFNLLARKSGFEVIYLGPSVPLSDLQQIQKVKQAVAFVSSFVSAYSAEELNELFNMLHYMFPKLPFFISGYQLQNIDQELPEGFTVVSTAKSFKEAIESLKD